MYRQTRTTNVTRRRPTTRRDVLAGLTAVGTVAVAGCASSRDATDQSTTASPEPTATTSGDTIAGVELPVSRSKLERGAPKDAIPAITDPVFDTDWSGVTIETTDPFSGDTNVREPRLTPEDPVIGIEKDNEARAYPLRVLNWHEVVNDEFQGPTLVTFCPLCGSGVTAERRVQNEPTRFGVSGLLWNSDLVMYDALTESLWSQIAGTAIRGPETGTRLSLLPSRLTTLATWRESHPETLVLRPPPESETLVDGGVRDYTTNPYAGYDESGQIGIGANDAPDDRLDPKQRVLGITHDGTAVAYPLSTVTDRGGLVNDTVAGRPVVVTVGPDDQSLFGFVRRVEQMTLTFERTGPRRMTAGDSVFSTTTGEAVDGPLAGSQLPPATDMGQLFWFAWADFHPDTEIFGRDE